jgi:hypothetical protein
MTTAKATPAQAENGQNQDVPLLSRAAQKRVWSWDSSAFKPLKQFLLAL